MNPFRLIAFALVFIVLSTWPFTLGRHMGADRALILIVSAGQTLTLYPNLARFWTWATTRA